MICRTCGIDKPPGDYYRRTVRCKACLKERRRQWRKTNLEEERLDRDAKRDDRPRKRQRRDALELTLRGPTWIVEARCGRVIDPDERLPWGGPLTESAARLCSAQRAPALRSGNDGNSQTAATRPFRNFFGQLSLLRLPAVCSTFSGIARIQSSKQPRTR